MRTSGILLPVASLPSKYGIGTLGRSAYEWIDFLKRAGQHYWQILPMGQTGYGDSPYQSFSAFAGNPYFIDLDMLREEGLLKPEEIKSCDFGGDPMYVDYGKLYENRYSLLRKAFHRSPQKNPDFLEFRDKEAWLDDYALYMAIKNSQDGLSWQAWPEALKFRRVPAMNRIRRELREDIAFYEYLQFLFAVQWKKLKAYAKEAGVEIIGDIPIYVAPDSADAWSHPELLQLGDDLKPIQVAGCPPDAFSSTGQLWGNPLYQWDVHKETGYAWWIQRIAKSLEYYDVVRIDHFRGFEAYYAVPYGAKTAETGHWEPGPGYAFFDVLNHKLGKVRLIAEDLGYLTEYVHALLRKCGYPGMKVLQFAFDSGAENPYLPHQHVKNSVVYTGTHDNETLLGWRETLTKDARAYTEDYLHITEPAQWCPYLIDAALASVADTAIVPIQDYLELGTEARVNEPSTLGKNWKWRLQDGQITEELAERIRTVSKRYGRA